VSTYGFSVDNERWYGENDTTREAAVETARNFFRATSDEEFTVYTCVCEEAPDAGHFAPDGDDIVEMMRCKLQDNEHGGDHNEDWLSYVSREDEDDLTERLEALVNAWAKERGYAPDWWTATDIQEHVVRADVSPSQAHCVLCSREMVDDGAAGACLECVAREEALT
jgi:hypothetical protein